MASTFPPPRIALLQRVVAEPVTDPAEQAALDNQRRRSSGVGSLQRGGAPVDAGASLPWRAIWEQLSAQERHSVLLRLAAELSSGEQLVLLEQLAAQVMPGAAQELVAELRMRLAERGNGTT